MPFKVFAFAGSLRKHSYNRGLVRAAKEVAPSGIEIEMFDLDDIPHFNQDVEAEGDPDSVTEFKDQIWAADALLIATPEHSASIPGILKNALDWASRPPADPPIKHKPVALIGATPGRLGTALAQNALRPVLIHNDSYLMARPQLLVTDAGKKFDQEGNLIDIDTRQRLTDLLEALASWAQNFKD